jgi:hypothetical protein
MPLLTTPRALFRAALAAWLVIVLASWLLGGPLGHDEAAYAIGGAARLAGKPLPWLYRSEGMHLLAMPGLLAGGSELALRLPSVVIAIGLLFSVRRVGDRLGRGAGAWAAAVVVGTHGLAMRGHELLSDVPSTACLLMAIAILAEELERDGGPRYRLMGAAVWLATGFYLRYASCVPIAIIGAAATLVWWRAILARPAPVAATLALFAALIAPHVVQSIAATGSPLGIIRYSADVPYHLYVGDGLVTYLTGNAFVRYGVVAAPVLLAGLISVVRPPAAGRRPARLLWLVALGQIVVLGLRSHAMTRYVYVALVLLIVLGVDAIARAAARPGFARWAPRARQVALGLVVLSWLGVAAAVIGLGLRGRDWRTPIVEAAAVVKADAAGRPCHVVSRRFTQLMWYAGCESGTQRPLQEDLDRWPLVYGVWFKDTFGTAGPDAFWRTGGHHMVPVELAHPDDFTVTRFTPPPEPGAPAAGVTR